MRKKCIQAEIAILPIEVDTPFGYFRTYHVFPRHTDRCFQNVGSRIISYSFKRALVRATQLRDSTAENQNGQCRDCIVSTFHGFRLHSLAKGYNNRISRIPCAITQRALHPKVPRRPCLTRGPAALATYRLGVRSTFLHRTNLSYCRYGQLEQRHARNEKSHPVARVDFRLLHETARFQPIDLTANPNVTFFKTGICVHPPAKVASLAQCGNRLKP